MSSFQKGAHQPEVAVVATDTNPAPLATLADEIAELAAHIHAATYRFLVLVRELDARGGWAGPGLKSCAHWLSWQCGVDLGAALTARNRRDSLAIHPRTPIPDWDGEPMDDAMAVERLLQADQ